MLHRKLPSFLTTVVQALKDPQPTLRTRALKVLCHVVECRPTPQDLVRARALAWRCCRCPAYDVPYLS